MTKWISKEKKIKLLTQCLNQAESLKTKYHEDPKFDEWYRDTRVIIEKIFDEKHAEEFTGIYFHPMCISREGDNSDLYQKSYLDGLNDAIAQINSLIHEVELWDDDFEAISVEPKDRKWALVQILQIIDRFDLVVKQLRQLRLALGLD